MIVFVAGMPRSGSTFTYSVVREALLLSGSVKNWALGGADEAIARAGTTHLIVKAHTASPVLRGLVQLGAAHCICSVRRLEDAAASWMETFGFDEEKTIEDMKKWVAMFMALKPHSLTIPYELIDSKPTLAAELILKRIGADPSLAKDISARYSKSKVKRTYDAMQIDDPKVMVGDFSYCHEDTFFHRNHVRSIESIPAEQRLSAAKIETIRNALADEIEIVSKEIELSPG